MHLKDHFHVTQSFYEDYFEYEFVKADGGQTTVCGVIKTETIGNNIPSHSEVYLHPNLYTPSLEKLNNMTSTERYSNKQKTHCPSTPFAIASISLIS